MTVDVSEYVEQQDELEEIWESCVEKYSRLWGEEGCEFLSTIQIVISPKAGNSNALALTYIVKDTYGEIHPKVSFNPLIDSLDSETYAEVVLHEMCHCMAWYDEKTLSHNEDWHYYVDKLNKNAGYEIKEKFSEEDLFEIATDQNFDKELNQL